MAPEGAILTKEILYILVWCMLNTLLLAFW